MITFPNNLTVVPNCPGYFWDTVDHRLYSIKAGGVLRELKVLKLWPGATRYSHLMRSGEKHYVLSVKGIRKYKTVAYLKNLKLVNYNIPIFTRQELTHAN